MPSMKTVPVDWVVHISFCVPGVIAVALMQWEDYHGLGGNANKPYSRTTALPVLPAFVSNLLGLPLLFRYHWTEESTTNKKDDDERTGKELRRLYDHRMWAIAICAVVGEIANQSSIVLAGSLTFTVVYSSVTIWTALFGIPLLGKYPSHIQWVALVLIVVGLLSSAMSHTAHKDVALVPHHNVSTNAVAPAAEKEDAASASDFIVGALCGLIGSMAYALMYVMTEWVQKDEDGRAPPPVALCVFVGMVGTVILLAYIAVWDGPSWKYMVNDQLTASYYDILTMYFMICVCCFLHNLAFYYLTRLSAVMAGINKAVQAVSVFAVSHLCYCNIDAQQCLTTAKVVAMTLVIFGVLVFSFAKKWQNKSNEKISVGVDDLDSIDQADGFRLSNISRPDREGTGQTSEFELLQSQNSKERPFLTPQNS